MNKYFNYSLHICPPHTLVLRTTTIMSGATDDLDQFWQLLFHKVPRFGRTIAASAQYILSAVLCAQQRRFSPSSVVPQLHDWSSDIEHCPCTTLGVVWPNHNMSLLIEDDNIEVQIVDAKVGTINNHADSLPKIVDIILQHLNDHPSIATGIPPHPEQPTARYGKNVRFRHNSIVQTLLKTNSELDYYALLKKYRAGEVSLQDWLQFNQLIGSTLTAYEQATLDE